MFYVFAVLFAIAAFAVRTLPSQQVTKTPKAKDGDKIVYETTTTEMFPRKSLYTKILGGLAGISLAAALFFSTFFYAEPGYMYHVRTITGQEKMVNDVGYNMYLFGRYNAWKKSMSIVSKAQYSNVNEDNTEAEVENDNMASSILGPVRAIFLDQVDAQISATARFMLPTEEESFLLIARQYRSPDNLIRTTLLPAFRETLQANAALMGAEDYFAGKRTEFNIDFEEQLKNGLYLVRRKEVVQAAPQNQGDGTADASRGTEQEAFGDEDKVVFVVEKITRNGVPVRKAQSYAALGISVVESRITDVVPNKKFNDRMQLKQQASADRAIAREQRIQEEEQKLLAEARGQREVAERQAAMKVEQIERTTKAETEKAEALINANRQLEQAEIEKQAAAVQLERDQISAQSIEVLADAKAYEREALLQADNALQLKLDTEVAIQKVWAQAFSQRKVPNNLWVTGATDTDAPMAGNTELQQIQQLMTMQLAKTLDYDREVKE